MPLPAADAPFTQPTNASTAVTRTCAGAWSVAMADFALELHGSFADVAATTDAVAASAVKLLSGVTAAGVVCISKDGVLTCLTSTNPQALQMVQAERRTGTGPCRHALVPTNPAKIVVNASGSDHRWPHYAAEALSIGVVAIMAVRLDTGAGAGAAGQALLLIADREFENGVVGDVDVFAAHAAVALAQVRVHAELAGALHSRDIIGQAKGILMHRHRISSNQAFKVLVGTSQNTNIALRQVAEQITATSDVAG